MVSQTSFHRICVPSLCHSAWVGHDISDMSYRWWEEAELVSLHSWQLNFANVVGFLCHTDKLQIHVHLVVYQDLPCPLVQCCFLSRCHPACLVGWLMLFLVQDFAFTFERFLSGHFFSLLSFPSRVLPACHTLWLLRAHFVSSLLKPLNNIYLICLSQ